MVPVEVPFLYLERIEKPKGLRHSNFSTLCTTHDELCRRWVASMALNYLQMQAAIVKMENAQLINGKCFVSWFSI